MSGGQNQPPKRKGRSGSENRKRQPRIIFRVSPEERAEMEASAAAAGLSLSSFIRSATALRQRTAVRRRPSPDMQRIAQVMAQVGRIGGNLAQFLKLANRGEIVAANDLAAAVQEARALIADAQKALRG